MSALALLMQIGVLGIIAFVEWWLSNWLNVASKPVTYQVLLIIFITYSFSTFWYFELKIPNLVPVPPSGQLLIEPPAELPGHSLRVSF